MITAKPRVVFAILFGLLGIPAAFLAAMAATGFISGLLWLYVFGDSPWPPWTGPVITVVMFVAALFTFAATIVLGVRYGQRLEGSGEKVFARKVRLTTGMVVLVWIAFGTWQYLNYRGQLASGERYRTHQEAVKGLKEIGSVEVRNSGDHLKINLILTDGRAGIYETAVVFSLKGYLQGTLWEELRNNRLSAGQGVLEFAVPLTELAVQYRNELALKVSSFQEGLEIDDILEIRATLRPVSDGMMAGYGIPESAAVRHLDVTFACQGKNCRLLKLQEGKP